MIDPAHGTGKPAPAGIAPALGAALALQQVEQLIALTLRLLQQIGRVVPVVLHSLFGARVEATSHAEDEQQREHRRTNAGDHAAHHQRLAIGRRPAGGTTS